LLGGWREAHELGQASLDGALAHLGARIDTTGEGVAVTVFNALSWPRTDIARVVLDVPDVGSPGIALRDDSGNPVPFLLEAADRRSDGTIARATVAFLACDVPALGYRTYRAVPDTTPLDDTGWREIRTPAIENETYRVAIDARRGGAVSSLVDMRSGKELIQSGRVANELLAYREYPNHPLFAEGPWHLTPDGRSSSMVDHPVEVTAEECPIGRRIVAEGPFEACERRQEIVLWDGLERVELTTRLDGYTGQDRLFRVRFPVAVEGGAPVSEVGNAVVGRPFGFPNVDVSEVPFTLDNPAYNWFALGATARVSLVDPNEPTAEGRASRAIGVAEVIACDDPELDDAVRGLVVALVRQGVTSTLSRHDGPRYGVLHIDSNLPDVRLAIGGPNENRFVAGLLDAAGQAYSAELDGQLAARGGARLWVPATGPRGDRMQPFPDLRGARDLPVLVVAGVDPQATIRAIDSLAADLADGVITIEQPPELDGASGSVEDYTVAVLNRGLPGFNVEADGSLYVSLMRSCTGWPSGVWIDPPRRAAPDGSNFQFQHWSHTFEYALVATPGDWRTGRIAGAGHEYNNPLVARVFDGHPGELPGTASLIAVEPASVVATVVKPAGNPLARQAGTDPDPADGLILRLYESSGRSTDATIRCMWPLGEAHITNITEETTRPVGVVDGRIDVHLEPFEIVTVRAMPWSAAPATRSGTLLAPRIEPAQPVFSDYWLHNKGAAPMGYQPVTVQVRPWLVRGGGPFRLPVVVASERPDGASAGSVDLVLPPGWEASPAQRLYRLAPGAHLEFEASIIPAAGAVPGRYFVAARISDEAGQLHEDIVTIDLGPEAEAAGDGDGPGNGQMVDPVVGSRSLSRAIERALQTAGIGPGPDRSTDGASERETGGELAVELLTREVRLTAGQQGEMRVSLRSLAASEIRGEAQIVSPHETWPVITPWTQGFAVGPGEEAILTFVVEPPYDFAGGTYWALVKVMYFGRLLYTESVIIELLGARSAGRSH
jgi:hypothetical protein